MILFIIIIIFIFLFLKTKKTRFKEFDEEFYEDFDEEFYEEFESEDISNKENEQKFIKLSNQNYLKENKKILLDFSNIRGDDYCSKNCPCNTNLKIKKRLYNKNRGLIVFMYKGIKDNTYNRRIVVFSSKPKMHINMDGRLAYSIYAQDFTPLKESRVKRFRLDRINVESIEYFHSKF